MSMGLDRSPDLQVLVLKTGLGVDQCQSTVVANISGAANAD
jgi:hypothetical protein